MTSNVKDTQTLLKLLINAVSYIKGFKMMADIYDLSEVSRVFILAML